jgi:cellulose 1,4-beta-cellobiosidase
MRYTDLVMAMSLAGAATASPFRMRRAAPLGQHQHHRRQDVNPWEGKTPLPNPSWSAKLEPTYEHYVSAGDEANAAKVRAAQATGTFFWISNRASLPGIDEAIAAGRAAKAATGEDQVVGLVLYNLPDRDCSAGESAGELESAKGGLEIYKNEYIGPWAEKLAAATDLTFAVVLEPDSLANLVTNMGVEFCAQAKPVYQEGIAYAIAKLQFPHVHLYMDAAHGGWLGWDDNLAPSAKEFADVVNLAKQVSGSNSTTIRGFSTNVSNYNPYIAVEREPYTEWSNSWDESHYAASLAPHLEAEGLPAKFIIDQGRVALPGARAEWGEWCNVAPAGFGIRPGTAVESELVDSIVWIKPGGESDGECGLEGAPRAGAWFPEYVQLLVENADPSLSA